jgi:hypothetical protein
MGFSKNQAGGPQRKMRAAVPDFLKFSGLSCMGHKEY